MTLLEENRQHQEYQKQHRPQHQHRQPQSPFSIDTPFTNPHPSLVFETPVGLKDERVKTVWSPPQVISTKTERRLTVTPKACIVPPVAIAPPDATRTKKTKTNERFPRHKRQRSCFRRRSSLPPMIPGSPELYSTPDSNPFGRLVAIHSPIAGIGRRLNLGYIGEMKASKSYRESQIQPSFVFPPCPKKVKRQTRPSLSPSRLSSSSDESEEICKIQTLLPVLEDSLNDNVMRPGDENRGDHDNFDIASTLKIRRRCSNHKL